MTTVIALDASTTTIGIAILEYDGYVMSLPRIGPYIPKLVHYEFYKPNKELEFLDMLLETRKYISSVISKFKVEEFVIEDYIRFMAGGSTAGTTIPLAVLNMTLRLMALDDFSIVPHTLTVLKIRHCLKKDDILPAKEEIPELVAYHLGMNEFPWVYKINKRTKEPKAIVECYDMADAMAVGLAWIKLKQPQPKKTRKKKT